MATVWNAIYLGKLEIEIDTVEGDGVNSDGSYKTGTYNVSPQQAENARALEGSVFGNDAEHGPLFNHTHQIRPIDKSSPTNQTSYLDQNNRGDEISVDLNRDGTAEVYKFDGVATYSIRLTYHDGTTSDPVDLNVFQVYAREGEGGGFHTFIAPPRGAGSSFNALNEKAIKSLELISLQDGTHRGLWTDRSVVNYFCFAKGTLIATPEGQVAVEKLDAGSAVYTADGDIQHIRWAGHTDMVDLQASPDARPIRISAGSLGDGLPVQDLVVSPQHRILVRSKIAQRMFDAEEVLVAAKHLLEIDGIARCDDLAHVSYYHFLLDEHHIVWANGAMSESLFPGPVALENVGPAARAEILALFPHLAHDESHKPARPLIKGRLGRQLATRHVLNNVKLQADPDAVPAPARKFLEQVA
ncbi:Hint domain-containing protein [Yoonia sp.]|uniref:Hint domain-containing protein n=1 Tax=Yoonia sp. TaxID=2212373 RepID=UPI00391B454E